MIISRTFDVVVFCYNLFAVDSLRLKLHTQDLITITNAVDTQNLPAFIFPASLRNWLRFCHELNSICLLYYSLMHLIEMLVWMDVG